MGTRDSRKKVVSFAVLCFPDKKDHANAYQWKFWGNEVFFTFPVVKVTDYRHRWAALERSENLFAVVVMAHLKAADVKNDEDRKYWKFKLMKDLYVRGLSRAQLLQLFKFIDWLIVLPAALNQKFWSEIYALEEEKNMPYITSVERIGMEKGFEQGLEQGAENTRQCIIEVLEDKFGQIPSLTIEKIKQETQMEVLIALMKLAAKSVSIEQFVAAFPRLK